MTTKLHSKTVRKLATIKKAKSPILNEHPLTQRFIASKLGISSGTVIKNSHKDSKLKQMFKPKVRLFFLNQIAERKANSRKLCKKLLAAEKSKFMVTLDEISSIFK
ncbi:hypothetical protein TNCV_570501 [Trichonephila clavipes]|nr:hypothetical protein TNCV_570501 [Trichonephila clavipes]